MVEREVECQRKNSHCEEGMSKGDENTNGDCRKANVRQEWCGGGGIHWCVDRWGKKLLLNKGEKLPKQSAVARPDPEIHVNLNK